MALTRLAHVGKRVKVLGRRAFGAIDRNASAQSKWMQLGTRTHLSYILHTLQGDGLWPEGSRKRSRKFLVSTERRRRWWGNGRVISKVETNHLQRCVVSATSIAVMEPGWKGQFGSFWADCTRGKGQARSK